MARQRSGGLTDEDPWGRGVELHDAVYIPTSAWEVAGAAGRWRGWIATWARSNQTHSRAPAQHFETHARAASAQESQVRRGPGREIDHHAFRTRTFCRAAVDYAHDDLSLVGEICNANDGSEGVVGVCRDHGILVERDAAGGPFSMKSRPVVRRQTLPNLEDPRWFVDRGRGCRPGRARRDQQDWQQRQPEASGPSTTDSDLPFRAHPSRTRNDLANGQGSQPALW